MYGPPMFATRILARALDCATIFDSHGNLWRYHSRSDRHSKIACWGILFDLLVASPILRQQALEGEVVFGINHEMRDFRMNRKKNLDLVVCTPGAPERKGSFKGLVKDYDLVLDDEEKSALAAVPDILMAPVGAVRIALEAKACMTAHQKALPRLYDELNSSQMTIHGNSEDAIAVGYVLVNAGEEFMSSDKNKHPLTAGKAVMTTHKQPRAAEQVVAKVKEIPRRTRKGHEGFDGLAIAVVDFDNALSPTKIVEGHPAPPAGDIFHYASMIHRVASAYDTRFR